jgi:hypothetical protein
VMPGSVQQVVLWPEFSLQMPWTSAPLPAQGVSS